VIDKAIAALNENTTTALQQVAARDPAGITLEAVCSAARSGDRLASRLLKEAGAYIGIAVGNIVNLLNPPLIVLAGGAMAAAGDLLLEAIRREAGSSAFEVAFAETKIVNSPLDRLSAARGAALNATRLALRSFWDRIFGDHAMD
jgi:glucokinase